MVDADFDRAWAFTHSWECWGGARAGTCRVADHPADPGGPTLHGIAKNYHPEEWRAGPPTVDQAGAFYLRKFWLPAQCHLLPWPLNLAVFDWAVHAGEDDPAIVLQVIANLADPKVDADIGPVTAQAIVRLMAREMAERVIAHRRVEVFKSPRSRTFPGWKRRVAAIRELALAE